MEAMLSATGGTLGSLTELIDPENGGAFGNVREP
jgi:hypothetical protein